MHTIKNDHLQIDIKSIGAELCAISSVKSDNSFLWHGDPEIWGSYAPNLFPIIGSLKDDSYSYNGAIFKMKKHGFVRHNNSLVIKNKSKTEITFQLNSNEALYKIYPFLFQLEITYTLSNNCLTVNHTVKNLDKKTLFFSIGGHPAFKCPLYKNENYSDYFLAFETNENSETYLLNIENGLVTDKTESVFSTSNRINLHSNLFNKDALIFKDLKSRKVTLTHNNKGPILSVTYKDFPFLGVWAKPNAPFVCIEPWQGIADSENTNQNIKDKEGIIALELNSVFKASYSIEIDKRHLV